ncbi:MAG: hypothetical protein QGG36_16605, partial [Pirellulaceae bacterium]|nr:hypothetical protein [Pirellulaceae bacterium]
MDDTRQLTADLESSWKYVRRSAENVKKAPPDAVHTVARNVAHSYSVEQAGVTDLDRQTQIGLAVDWWVNPPPNSRVMFALDKSFLDHWASVVDDCLRRRRNARMQPTTWSELEQLLVGRNQTSE